MNDAGMIKDSFERKLIAYLKHNNSKIFDVDADFSRRFKSIL